MNHGPLIFLAAFFALASSWVGFVLTPQMQVGHLQQTNLLAAGVAYPLARPGLAQEGLDVYRANGCAYCHSQQVGQTATVCSVELNETGTNHAALAAALAQINPKLSDTRISELLASLPKAVLRGVNKETADKATKALNASGAKAQTWVLPAGPDIARGWGQRQSVARDFLFDYPVMLGSQRVGPDLANVGARLPDANWHLRHLYAPRLLVEGSTMPPYRFLFETRKAGRGKSAEALELPPELAPPAGFEVVPRREAHALTAYLLSLRADTPLFEAPFTVAGLVAQASGTNGAAGTNAVSGTNPPAGAPDGGAGTNTTTRTNAAVQGAATNAPSTNAPPR